MQLTIPQNARVGTASYKLFNPDQHEPTEDRQYMVFDDYGRIHGFVESKAHAKALERWVIHRDAKFAARVIHVIHI